MFPVLEKRFRSYDVACHSPLGSGEAKIKAPCLAQMEVIVERESSGGPAAARDAPEASSVQPVGLLGIFHYLNAL